MRLLWWRVPNPVEGTARVIACTRPLRAHWQPCRMRLVVQVDGWEPYSVEIQQTVRDKRWPQVGMTVPVMVSRDDPQLVRVDFKRVPTLTERAQADADRHIRMMQDGGALDPTLQGVVEQLTGLDLDGATVVTGPGERDRVSELERLASLHERGLLSDAEFVAAKRQILED